MTALDQLFVKVCAENRAALIAYIPAGFPSQAGCSKVIETFIEAGVDAIETAHALAGALQVGNELGKDAIIVINLSGRGDKDVQTAAQYFGIPLD